MVETASGAMITQVTILYFFTIHNKLEVVQTASGAIITHVTLLGHVT